MISELVSSQPNPDVIKWVDSVDEERLYLSVITLGEFKKGIEKLASSKRKSELGEWLEEDLFLRFQDRILSIEPAVMLVWGELVAGLEKKDKPMPAIDSLVAAVALCGELTLVTRNEGDFAHSGAEITNPWRT